MSLLALLLMVSLRVEDKSSYFAMPLSTAALKCMSRGVVCALKKRTALIISSDLESGKLVGLPIQPGSPQYTLQNDFKSPFNAQNFQG